MVLNLNWEIIWVFVNLLILFLLMKKFLFGPITKLLDERAKGVADTLHQAETQLAEAERQKAEYTQQLASARGEAAHIVEEARKRADLPNSRIHRASGRMPTSITFSGVMITDGWPNFFSPPPSP